MTADDLKRRLDRLSEPLFGRGTPPAPPEDRATPLAEWLEATPGIVSARARNVPAAPGRPEGVSVEVEVEHLDLARELAGSLPARLGDAWYWAGVRAGAETAVLTRHTEQGFEWAWEILSGGLPAGVRMRAAGQSRGDEPGERPWLLLVADDPAATARDLAPEHDGVDARYALRVVDREPRGRFELEQRIKAPSAVEIRVEPGGKIADLLRFRGGDEIR